MKTYIKGGLLVLHLLIAIFGLVLFTVGFSWIKTELEYEKATQKPYIYVGAILMSLGSLLGVFTLTEAYALLNKKLYLLKITAFCGLLFFLVYADYALFAFQLKSVSSPYMKDFGKELGEVFNETKKGWDTFFDHLHKKFGCCGVNGFEDFQKMHNQTIPVSCCRNKNVNCTTSAYREGCVKPFEDYIIHNFTKSGWLSLTAAFLILITSGVIYQIRDKKTVSLNIQEAEEEGIDV